jgi:hypothetical protein
MADMIFVRAAVVTLVLIVIEVALVSGLTVLVVEMLSAGRLGACAIPIRARPCSLHISEEVSVTTTDCVHSKTAAAHWHERAQHPA